jgi:glutamate-ammonia-ligase adenylyltransferase
MFARLITDPARLPKAADAARAEIGRARWRESAESSGNEALGRFARDATLDPAAAALLDAVFGNSPFLGQALIQEVAFVRDLAEAGPDIAFANVMAALEAGGIEAATDAVAMRALRQMKRRAALLIGLADIADLWPVERVTAALSRLADAALSATARRLLRRAAADGAFTLKDDTDAARGSGLIVLGMGKLGAGELNYSSDVDLIVLYEPERFDSPDRAALQRHVVKLTHGLVRHMAERTADGYVFRTDLRLRPDPGSTPPAIPVGAAETYYESLGQNWERAALIKARPCAGDIEAGAAFLAQLRPFVWRKYLDFAAIQDIHSIKRQVNAHHGGGEIAVAGHNLKLGRGGIREIELFAQTQQLIWGGREPTLRVPGTVAALDALAAAGRIEIAVARRLAHAYRFLRRIEHRLQMVADEQTHSLPETEIGVASIATFLGYADVQAFTADLLAQLRTVERHYAELFEEAPALGGGGNLVFTGTDHDPETLKTIARAGFEDPNGVSSIIRGWHHGRYRAMRSTRARELLTELTPALLAALAKTANPAAAFARFDEFLGRLPAGVQIFSLFYANPGLLDLVAQIMGDAPRLATHLARRPSALEAVLMRGFFDAVPDRAALGRELERALGLARDFEDRLAAIRRWINDKRFQIGVQILRSAIEATAAGAALADATETALVALVRTVEGDFARRHGRVPDGAMAVVALGKLGGREMTVRSDLDLIFIYEAPDDLTASDGPRPLGAAHYFGRLSQHVLNAMTAMTEEGALFEVDMRLRPSGRKGPIATNLAAFAKYQREAAWTWEHMALTRARVVSGPDALARRVEADIRDVLARPRAPDAVRAEVADLRARMRRERPGDNPWDAKHRPGGLVDVEFLAQFLQLRHAASGAASAFEQNTGAALARLEAAGALSHDDANILTGAWKLWLQVQGLLRLTVEGRAEESRMPDGLKAILARVTGTADAEDLKRRMAATAAQVASIFDREIGAPPDEASEPQAARRESP